MGAARGEPDNGVARLYIATVDDAVVDDPYKKPASLCPRCAYSRHFGGFTRSAQRRFVRIRRQAFDDAQRLFAVKFALP